MGFSNGDQGLRIDEIFWLIAEGWKGIGVKGFGFRGFGFRVGFWGSFLRVLEPEQLQLYL